MDTHPQCNVNNVTWGARAVLCSRNWGKEASAYQSLPATPEEKLLLPPTLLGETLLEESKKKILLQKDGSTQVELTMVMDTRSSLMRPNVLD